MKIRIGLNGFGNLSRVIFRQLMEQPDRFEVLGVNDLADPKALAVLLKYDSVYGRYKGKVEYDDEHLIVDGRKILITSVRNPAKLPWGDLGVSVGIENNLYCRDRQMDGKPGYDGHLSAGAKRVLLTMTARYHDRTVIAGLNDSEIIPEDCCISCGSGAAGAIAPIVKVLNDRFGVRCGQVTSIDSYSSDQQILDSPHHELHRARAAAINIIPTYNFAVEEVGSILPELRGKLLGLSLRVPTPVGRCVDLVINTDYCRVGQCGNEGSVRNRVKRSSWL